MTDSIFELETVLKDHAERYPLMEPTDAVKLIYQNEFGGGHLIRDEESCLGYLRREYEAVTPDPKMPLYEHIGNGILRVHLAAVKPEELEPLGRAFIALAARHTGSQVRFLEKLRVLQRLTDDGVFGFSPEELSAYLSEYAAAGYPPVSHSDRYCWAYRPAYRIICKAGH